MSNLKTIFNIKETENGDTAYKSINDKLIDILFLLEFFQKNLNKIPKLDSSEKEKLFAMFIRDPRYGFGKRDIGRILMKDAKVSFDNIIKAGRYDDLWHIYSSNNFKEVSDYLKKEIISGNELAKKWMPRYSSKHKLMALKFMKQWNLNKKNYSKFIKTKTVEYKMSLHEFDSIDFEKVPSLAMLKYYNAWSINKHTRARFLKYLEDVNSGRKKINISTTTVYDIYRNRSKIDPDLFFSKLEKVSGSWIPILDTSGSMMDNNDSIGKATSIAHYLAKNSTYLKDYVISFSSKPQLLSLSEDNVFDNIIQDTSYINSIYLKEIKRMYTGDYTNTDFGKVMELLRKLDENNIPEYLIVLSDMEFDMGSSLSKDETMNLFKQNNFNTKIIWWNFNSRNITCPETDEYGNIFLSGYNPFLLKYLSVNFDSNSFLNKLLEEYKILINN